VSKSTAKSKVAPKKAPKKPSAAPAKKPAAKKAAPAAKKKAPVPAKKPAARKAPPKPVPKVAPPKAAVPKASAKPAAKAAPAPKPAPKSAPLKPTPAPAAAKPLAKPEVADKPAAPPKAPRGSSSKNVSQPMPAAPDMTVSRFADRFAPAKPSRPIAMPEHVRPTVKFDAKVAAAWKTKAGHELSEPELLAMPDAEYMNDKQLDFFRARLTALKDDLLSNAGETTEHLREDTSIVPDPADRATIEEEHALELRTRDRERKLLKKISQSLARIEAGDYGFCDETGEPIGLARLLARPTATLSLEAQQRREMKQKMFGD
jgi:DnaK suppressor protein